MSEQGQEWQEGDQPSPEDIERLRGPKPGEEDKPHPAEWPKGRRGDMPGKEVRGERK